ncbi:HAMP domain-containing sensor histidine kinase [Nocardioides sp.]|uniref:sensor histidine kinase n=1 Tax=Nocardioides sp. TaxID=35761 RepID=UPI0025E25F26|nr:HAMP domain-containing sensor histidine kinase [Nocardioides sp.]
MHFPLLDEIRQTRPLPRRLPGQESIREVVRGAARGLGAARRRPLPRSGHAGRPPSATTVDLEAQLALERDRLHELRSTVGGLVASYHLLQEQAVALTPAARSRLEHLHDVELGRLERLLADPCEDPAGPVDLALAIDPIVEMLRLGGHDVRWSGTDAQAWGRQDDVTQVVHVLLDNAVRHAYGREVEVVVVTTDSLVEVRVHDLGPGVAPEVREVLFERGVRRTGSPGQGIGLSIAHRLADQMGAVLTFDPGDRGRPGTTFVLSLPILPACAAPSAAATPPGAGAAG